MPKAIFGLTDLLHREEYFSQNYKFGNKNDLICEWRNLKKLWTMQIHTTIEY